MKTNLIATAICCLTISASAVINSPIPGVYSTGVDPSGSPLSAGSVDPHYTLTASPLGPISTKVTAPYFMWLGGTATSAWINDRGLSDDSPAGYYTYSITFSLSGFDHNTASISGFWATDNTGSISLNGNPTGIAHSTPWDFVNFDAFTVNSGFVSGDNTLSFIIHNEPSTGLNPSGLQVQIQSATAVAVPEPSGIALFGCMSLVWFIRRRD